ncbi:hypothetical protein GpartN1_g3356.t1 [Galdieria partita]|uniref:Major facilitator superfamily (MFS) profile domain-containing protein n=1 Tax=Galdieria partita TaxID=83374 RepID=A0A9C7PWB0_9RHOD|nr:hypothetical protein GpartN1_g3356.t1 [Galdieria partita]
MVAGTLEPKECWTIAFGAALLNFLQVSCFFIAPAVLLPLVVKELKASLALAPVPIAIGKIAYVLFLVPEGIVLDSVGPCVFLIVGFIGLSFVSFLYSILVRNFTGLCFFHICLAAFASVTGVPVYSLLLSELFKENLGLALGLVLSGFSLAGTVVPFTLGPLAARKGWRLIWKLLSLALGTISVPIAFYIWRRFPAAAKRLKDSEFIPKSPSSASYSPRFSTRRLQDRGKLSSSGSPTLRNVSRRSLSRRPRRNDNQKLSGLTNSGSIFSPIYFSLMACYICVQYAYGCFNENILFFLTVDADFSLGHASLILSLINCAAFAAKLVGGHLGDTHDRYRLAAFSSASAAAGIIILFLPGTNANQYTRLPSLGTSSFQFFLFAIAFGAGYGSTFNCLYSIVPSVFPLSRIGVVQSSLFGFGLLGNATGALVTGSLREWTGSYDLSFSVAFVMCCIAFIVFHMLEVIEHHMTSSRFHSDEPFISSDSTHSLYKSEVTMPLYQEQGISYESNEVPNAKENESFLKRSTSSIAMIQHSKTFSSLVDRGVLSYSFDFLPHISVDNASDDSSEDDVEEDYEESVT